MQLYFYILRSIKLQSKHIIQINIYIAINRSAGWETLDQETKRASGRYNHYAKFDKLAARVKPFPLGFRDISLYVCVYIYTILPIGNRLQLLAAVSAVECVSAVCGIALRLRCWWRLRSRNGFVCLIFLLSNFISKKGKEIMCGSINKQLSQEEYGTVREGN